MYDPFKYGKNKVLHGLEYNDHELEPLLYDACQGLYISRCMVIEYFCMETEGGRRVGKPISDFVISQLHGLVNASSKEDVFKLRKLKTITYEELLNPLGGKKPSTLYGEINSYVRDW